MQGDCPGLLQSIRSLDSKMITARSMDLYKLQ